MTVKSYVRPDGRISIIDENGTNYIMGFDSLLGFMYWCYNQYTSEAIQEGQITFANSMREFIESRASDYFDSELY